MLDRVLVNWLHIALLDTRYVLGARSISEGGSWGSAVCIHTDVLFKHSKSDTRTHLDLVTHLKWLNALNRQHASNIIPKVNNVNSAGIVKH